MNELNQLKLLRESITLLEGNKIFLSVSPNKRDIDIEFNLVDGVLSVEHFDEFRLFLSGKSDEFVADMFGVGDLHDFADYDAYSDHINDILYNMGELGLGTFDNVDSFIEGVGYLRYTPSEEIAHEIKMQVKPHLKGMFKKSK